MASTESDFAGIGFFKDVAAPVRPTDRSDRRGQLDSVAIVAWTLIAAALFITWSMAIWSVGRLSDPVPRRQSGPPLSGSEEEFGNFAFKFAESQPL